MENLALIILNYNSAPDTLVCVNKLINFNADYHIVIVDNNSTDGSITEIKEKLGGCQGIDIIQTSTNGGYSAGNNFGMKYAIKMYNVEYTAILNPDVIIPDIGVIKKMLGVMERNSHVAVVGASAINSRNEFNPNLSSWNIPSARELIFDHFLLNRRKYKTRNFKLIEDKVAQVECVAGCFFIGRVSALEKVGFLDENVFLYNEENILGIKLKNEGYMEALVLDEFYIHNHKYHKSTRIPFMKKILTTKKGYESRRYLCKEFYSKTLLPFLAFVEFMNRVYLSIAYLKDVLKRIEEKSCEDK